LKLHLLLKRRLINPATLPVEMPGIIQISLKEKEISQSDIRKNFMDAIHLVKPTLAHKQAALE